MSKDKVELNKLRELFENTKGTIVVPDKTPNEMLRDEIMFFVEMLKTPGIDRENIRAINETIKRLLYQYNNPKIEVKGRAE